MKINQYISEYIADYKESYVTDFNSSFTHKQEDKWNYEDGCVLMGALQLYEATQEKRYKEFVINYLDKAIENDGCIKGYEETMYNIDSVAPGKVLFFAYEETGDEKYRVAIEALMNQLRNHPRTKSGNFWHKNIYPNQIWLDGLYMAQPFYMAYETKFNHTDNYKDIIDQFKNVRKYIYNEQKGLYYHAYDEARVQMWADKETGLSPNFWIRSMGWYLMAIIDTLDEISKEAVKEYGYLSDLFKEAIDGILQYQDKETKMFYQVIDRADVENNYLETSGTSMVAYAIMKGARLGVLDAKAYGKIGKEIFESLIEQRLIEEDGALALTGICAVAGLGPKEARDGSVEYYLSEPIVSNEQKAVGATMMAYAQYLMLKGNENG